MPDTLPFLLNPTRIPGVLVKDRPEDFVVEEIPLYEPSGAGTHTWLWIEKQRCNTQDLARRLARALGKPPREVGYAGLKDAQAIARQWFSLEHLKPGQAETLDLGADAKVLAISRHGNKLKTGHLRGNRFVVRLRLGEGGPDAGLLAAQAREALEQLARRGVPNYFGTQRFGREAANANLGRLLVAGDEAAYLAAARASGAPEARARDRRFRNLMVNAFQAELFNRVLARRMPHLGQVQRGDAAWLHRNGACFLIEDAAAEQPRADAFEISPSGPLFGPKMLCPGGEPAALEDEVLATAGVTREAFGARSAERQPGARRPLRVPLLEAPQVEAHAEGVVLRFALPSGSYATVVLREVLGED